MIFQRIANFFRQLLPLTYRSRYWDSQGDRHFAVWRQWFGRVFQIDDVVVLYDFDLQQRCLNAVDQHDYDSLQSIIDGLRLTAASRKAAVEVEASQLGEIRMPAPSRMQTLSLPSGMLDELHAGIRLIVLPHHLDVKVEPLKLLFGDPAASEVVDVVEVTHKRLSDVTDQDAQDEGSADAAELKALMQENHKGLRANGEMTLIRFFRYRM